MGSLINIIKRFLKNLDIHLYPEKHLVTKDYAKNIAEILNDQNIDWDEKHEVLLDAGLFDDPIVEEALIARIKDRTEDEDIVQMAANCLAIIRKRQSVRKQDILDSFPKKYSDDISEYLKDESSCLSSCSYINKKK